MGATRSYQQFCPTAAALDVVGDRWALLVVRELMLGPRRFTDLQRGLPGIGTDILTARLRGLEGGGIVLRRGEGRTRRYELTDAGRRLRPVLVELSRWGAHRLELPADPDDVSARVALTSLLLDPPPLPASCDGDYEIRTGDESARFAVRDGGVALCSVSAPGTTIELAPAALRGLLMGLTTEQLGNGVTVRGDAGAAHTLLDALSGPPLLEGLRLRHARSLGPSS